MRPRTRTISDDDILAAAAQVVARLGSADMTLADVGQEVGLAPATLLQRFGSKRGLLLALAASATHQVDRALAQVRAELDSPVAALIAAASMSAPSAASPAELANHLGFVLSDIRDDAFRTHALERARRLRDGYRHLIVEAIADGELADHDAEALARAVESMATGAVLSWSIHREGDAATFVRREVTTLLRGYGRGVWART